MELRRRTGKSDVRDVRRSSGGGGRGMAVGGGGIGIVGLILALIFGVDITGGGGSGGGFGGVNGGAGLESLPDAGVQVSQGQLSRKDDLALDMETIVGDVQDFWEAEFEASGQTYPRSELFIFEGSFPSGCGGATEAIGPHYCPADQNMYLDLDFFAQLEQQFGAPGDFAQAYVVAHEVAHHVQNVVGIGDQVRQASAQNPSNRNELSIRQELQADCLAGVWAHTLPGRVDGDVIGFDESDFREALGAAEAVGDDRIQEATTGRVDPHQWTHGSAEQRMEWFTRGFESGDSGNCDTFS